MFPNKHLVYLHDTPSHGLFESTERTFSSCCIRVENPFELAELLLADEQDWGRDHIDRTVQEGQTRTIHLSQPLPVLLLYWTADPDLGGGLRFYKDVYERDEAILKALGQQYQFRPRT